VRPLRTVAIGVIGGFAVGVTSVGAGSLIIALLLIAYPRSAPRSWSEPTSSRRSRWSRPRRWAT